MEETNVSGGIVMEQGFIAELRAFMQWSRETLAQVDGRVERINDKVATIEAHCAKQNGDIKLVMERERETRERAVEAAKVVSDNVRAIATLEAITAANKEQDRDREQRTAGELNWLKENVWKLALGGVSTMALLNKLVELIAQLNGP